MSDQVHIALMMQNLFIKTDNIRRSITAKTKGKNNPTKLRRKAERQRKKRGRQ